MRKVVPLGKQVLLQGLDPLKDTGGIIIPETAKQVERLDYFIEDIGPLANKAYPSLAKGMRVVIGKYKEQTFTHSDGNKYILVNVEEIQGIIE